MPMLLEAIFAGIPVLLVFVLGACIGSFLNVVVYRLPAGMSLLWPSSRCPHCGHVLGPTENVPIVGWLRLKGRCWACRTPISMRYPLVEAAMGYLFAVLYGQFGLTWHTLGFWAFVSWLLALALIDLDTKTLPGALTKSGLVLGLVFQAVVSVAHHSSGTVLQASLSQGIFQGIVSAVLGILLLDGVRVFGSLWFRQEAMGTGDPHMAAMMGAWLGWKLLLLSLFLACAAGALLGGVSLLLGQRSRRQELKFGPFLALGALMSVFWGQKLIQAYLGFFFVQL